MFGMMAAGALPPLCLPGVARTAPENHAAMAQCVDFDIRRAGPGVVVLHLASSVADRADIPIVARGYEDLDTDVLRQFFVDLQQAWDEYAETDELRREGLQEAYITGL